MTSEAGTDWSSWTASVAKESLLPSLLPEKHQDGQQPAKAGQERRGVLSLSLTQRRTAQVLRNRTPQSRWEAANNWNEAAWRRLPPSMYSTLCRTAATKHWQYFAELRSMNRARNRPKPYDRRPSRLYRSGASEELVAERRTHKELCHASEEGPGSNETSSERAMQSNEAASDACAQLDAGVSGTLSANAQVKQCSCAAQETPAQPIDGYPSGHPMSSRCTYLSMQQNIYGCS
ncbi:hypothetical protein COCOBI_14-3810 [Coccomyxa sp. Obi]|nr:hypothetical protein COCOBI_14-3810 [Coccomyxa sp. Obi]